MDFPEYLAARRPEVELALDRCLPRKEGPAGTIADAMRYAVLGGGKRLRPVLVLAAHEACGGRDGAVVAPAAALELIHTYSLIHDDLPAMDDDDLRRGRATVHRVYGEAQAILAGDALLTLAFEILGERPPGAERAAMRAEAVVTAARGAGIAGMVGGQMADLEAGGVAVDAERLRWIHRHKTGALFAASCAIGAIHAGATVERRRALAGFGEALGLAFQIADDLLDRSGTARTLGKTPGKDQRVGKATYPALYGTEASMRQAEALVDEATSGLRSVGLLTAPLRSLAAYAVERRG